MSRASLSLTASLGVSLTAVALLAAPAAARAEEGGAAPGAAVIVVVPAAPAVPAVPAADVVEVPAPSSRPAITLGIGLRGMLMPSAGFDPFGKTDFLVQGSVTAGVTVVHVGNASILLFAEYAGGQRSGTARGESSSLALHRLGGGAETRYQLGRRFYLAARLAPVALRMLGSITDASLDRPLSSSAWTWGLDVSGGAGVQLNSYEPNGVKFLMTLDFGYSFAGESKMSYAPAATEDDPRKFGSVMLPALKPSGATSRLGFAVAF